MKIVAISDVHGKWNTLTIPECDLLISAGDYSFRGERHMVVDFHKWLSKQPARHVISVQGNHELWVESNWSEAKQLVLENAPRIHFIYEGPLEIEGVKIWCCSITPFFCNWAWNRQRGEEIKKHWDRIPDDTQVLVTHGPPKGILDLVGPEGFNYNERVGCNDLFNKIQTLKQLRLHIFGHIHGASGEQNFNGVTYLNASICDERYMSTNPIRIFEL